MKVIKENLRTVASELEEGFNPIYEVHCLVDKEDSLCGSFNDFEEAYLEALRVAQMTAEDDFELPEDKVKIIKSIFIYEPVEGRDVTTAELKNELNKIKNSI